MEIVYLKEVDSTQKYLLNNLKSNICIWTDNQTDGIGSRGNKWETKKGNLFFSFCIDKKELPKDLLLQSVSIYYMYQLKIVLTKLGSKVIFKWPNDLYLNKKVGGIISNIKNNFIVIGIGLNTHYSPECFSNLDIDIDNYDLLDKYFNFLSKKYKWKEIFEFLKEEFYNHKFITSQNIDLSKSKLNEDGSIEFKGKRIYSLR